ncbi:MAG: type II secretion system F family protein, partial [Thiothrix sp.]
MPLYSYQAVTTAGIRKDGTLEASSEMQVVDSLQAQGLIPVNITLSKTAISATAKPNKSGGFFKR